MSSTGLSSRTGWRGLASALAALTLLAAAGCGNQFTLFGTKPKPKPDIAPEDWDPGYGTDKYYYFWRVQESQLGEEKGTIFRKNIHTSAPPEPFWVSPEGKCVGCHSLSPDGKYMAVVELTARLGLNPTVHIVDIEAREEVPVPGGPLAGTYTSWKPDPGGDPPYQFVMASPAGLQIASVTDGIVKTLAETSLGDIATMPSWGPNGRIAYARGPYGDPRLTLYEQASIWTIAEDGTDPQPLIEDPAWMSYLPAWSPNGRWVAFVQAPADSPDGTISAPDGRIRICDVEESVVINPDDLNNATNSGKTWPTWSAIGNRLTCGTADPGEESRDSDIFLTHFDPETGLDWEARRVDEITTDTFEHIPRWAP
jgi:Tol biopolymer transport system component